MIKKVAIIGSHGLYARYGGFDQLVNNLAEKKSDDIEYLIFNPKETPPVKPAPEGVRVKYINLKAAGFQGLFYDFWSILIASTRVDTLLLLGAQGMLILPLILLFKKMNIVTNVGGMEWERPAMGFFPRLYLKLCFSMSFIFSDYVILDNEFFKKLAPGLGKAEVKIIPYGGFIDESITDYESYLKKYPFMNEEYFLSISRSIPDNMIEEICTSFMDSDHKLVLISNLSNSEYGKGILRKYSDAENISIIDGLYVKPELDMIRRNCKAYIHTHTLCGTAPSLVEMIICQRPILSIDNPQNRFTLSNQGIFYSSFDEVQSILDYEDDLNSFIPDENIKRRYHWDVIVKQYENLY